MYERKVDEQVLTIGNERWKYHDSMVMYDSETGTQWVQASGMALHGPLEGRELKPMAAELTRLSSWKSSRPGALVLAGVRADAPRSRRIHVLSSKGLEHLSLVSRVGTSVRAYPLELLDARGLIEDRIDETPVAVVFSRDPALMRVYKRSLGDATLLLELVRRPGLVVLHERAGKREWDAASGRPLGDATTAPLEALPAYPIVRKRLLEHYPKATQYVEPLPATDRK